MKINPLIIGGGALAAIYLFTANNSSNPATAASNSLLSSLLPASAPAIPTTYGVNDSVIRTGASSHPAAATNYSALTAANPELLNQQHQLTPTEINQLLTNYLDLRQGIGLGVGGPTAANVQKWWTSGGVTGQYIFLPLVPVSNYPYIAPPKNSNSSGGGFFSGVLSAVTTVAPYVVAAIAGTEPQLNDVELQLLFTGGAVLKQILPMYEKSEPATVSRINQQFDNVLKNYI